MDARRGNQFERHPRHGARIAAGRQNIHTAGLNWYVSGAIRFMVARQARATSALNTDSKFDAAGFRTQVAF